MILNLVISSDNYPFYGALREEWRRYMNRHPSIRSFFIVNDPSKFEKKTNSLNENGDVRCVVEGNTMYFDVEESGVPGIYEKTVLALMMFQSFPQEWTLIDYVIRTNLSSFYRWDRLVSYLERHDIPRHGLMGGAINMTPEPCYVSGCGMIMSRDVAELLIQHYHDPIKFFFADDHVIGKICHDHGIGMTSMPRLDLQVDDWRDEEDEFIRHLSQHRIDDEDTFHIRTRCGTDAFRMEYGIQMYRRLVNHFYFFNSHES